MKLPSNSLLALFVAVVGFAGCGPQSSAPLAVAPPTKPATEAPQSIEASPSRTTSVPQKEDPFWSETREHPRIGGPLVPSSTVAAEAPPAAAPAAESKPAEKPNPSDSAPTRPKADREPTKPGDPEKITFDDLILRMQPDMVYRPFMLTDRAKELEGKRVRLTGEMLPYDSKKAKEFILLRNNKCLYGKGGAADHVAFIQMKEGHTIDYTLNTVRIEGNLKIEPVSGDDGNTKHLYVLKDAVAK